MYEVNTWLWIFGQPQPSVAALSVAKTLMISKRCMGAAAKSWEAGLSSKSTAEADAESLQTYDMYIPVIYLSYSLGQ